MEIGDRVKVLPSTVMTAFGHVGKEFTITEVTGKFAFGKTDRDDMLVIPLKRLTIVEEPEPPKSFACPQCGQMADAGDENRCYCLNCGLLFDDNPTEGGELRIGGGKKFARRVGRRS